MKQNTNTIHTYFHRLRATWLVVGALVLVGFVVIGLRYQDQKQLVAARGAVHRAAYGEAVVAYRAVKLTALGKDDLRRLATAYRQVGMSNDATKIDNQLTKRFGTEPDILLRQANLAIAEGRPDDAAHLYAELIRKQPAYTPGSIGLARLQYNRGAKDDAYALLQPGNQPAPVAIELLFEAASLAERDDDIARAQAAYAQILQLDPDNYLAQVGMGTIEPQPFPTALITAAEATR